MLGRRHFLLATVASAIGPVVRAAEPRISTSDARTIAILPRTASEIKDLYDRFKGNAAELLPQDEAFEIKTFAPFLTKRDEIEGQKRLPNTSTRRHVFSVGLEMLSEDQKQLPKLSGDQILSYLKGHYISIQARVYREPISGVLYLGPRCLAATRSFRGGKLTEAFTPTVAESVNNMRSLGLFLPDRTPPTPSNLRTLILVHKNELSQESKNDARGTVRAKTNYEYIFIRGSEADSDHLTLHAFATSEERTVLHWLRPADSPAIPKDCSVRGTVKFTEYSHQGMYPTRAVIRRSLITGHKTFTWASVDDHSRKNFDRPAIDGITHVLEAIISGDLEEAPAAQLPVVPRRSAPQAQTR